MRDVPTQLVGGGARGVVLSGSPPAGWGHSDRPRLHAPLWRPTGSPDVTGCMVLATVADTRPKAQSLRYAAPILSTTNERPERPAWDLVRGALGAQVQTAGRLGPALGDELVSDPLNT
jgi:hypothetical protein